MALPFAHLNLCRNPFGERDRAERAELAVVNIDHVMQSMCDANFVVQVIGEQGRGKTTHLLAIARHFPQATYVYIGEGERPHIAASDPLIIDEFQRVSPRHRRALLRRPVPVVIGSHEDHEIELRSAGRSFMTIEPRVELSLERVGAILQRRIEGARRGFGSVPRITPRTVALLIDQHSDNIRAMEGNLYEVFQNLTRVCDV